MHPDLGGRWEAIVAQIQQSPRRGAHIDHLKGVWDCSYRWDEGSYRIKYEVDDDSAELYFYDANNRGDVYRGRARRSQAQVIEQQTLLPPTPKRPALPPPRTFQFGI